MRKEIEEIRQALLAINALDDEAKDALATLESAIGEIDHHPDSAQVKDVVQKTAGTLSGPDRETPSGLAGNWQELKENISDWEDDYPSVVLAVGRVSNVLAAVGL